MSSPAATTTTPSTWQVYKQDMRTQAKERKCKEMIKDVPLTGVFVNDQEAALDFYTNKLGLEKVQDEPYGEGAHAGSRSRPRDPGS